MPASMATVDAITKEVYQGKIQNQLQDEAVGYKRIERSSSGVESQVGGKYVTFPLRVRRNEGIGYRNELEQLQAAGQQGFVSVRVGLKYGYGRVRLSGQTMELASENYQAFADAMDLEMSGLKGDIQKDTNRIFYGDGLGTLATVSTTAVADNIVAVDTTQYLNVGMMIDIVNAGTGAATVSNRQITAINGLNVTFDGATAADTQGQILVRTGNWNREPQGLSSIVKASGTLFNVDPTVQPLWKSVVNANAGTGRALSEGLMIKLTDDIRVNGGRVSLILTSLGVRRSYFNLLSQQRRYTNTKEFAGGLTGLAFNNGREIPVVEDPDAPVGKMWFLDESKFKIYRDKDWSWLQKDGSIWKWVHDYDAYEAVLKQYWELGINQRNAQGLLSDVTEA
ncbi:MAG TPA: phage major capsid protein [Patescibacteria group bacterium]|nr:phage major capsid protein [Patescibacteria group bacterium]